MQELEFGKKAKDKITGFTGTLTGYSSFITGCDQYCIVPKAKEEHVCPEGKWFDVNRIEIIEDPIKNSDCKIDTSVNKGTMDCPPAK